MNANLEIDPEETQIAIDQASRFSQTCKVYAPIYPQLTLAAINTPGDVTPEAAEKAYLGVLSAWQEYLAKYNDGRGVVLIGHSQGALLLEQLIKEQVDPNPALRKQLVSAIALGRQRRSCRRARPSAGPSQTFLPARLRGRRDVSWPTRPS